MKLGDFADSKARHEAVQFLQTSISTLSMILGLDMDSFSVDSENPYDQSSPMHSSYSVLKSEVIALNKIKERML
jgi:hypothetical protein